MMAADQVIAVLVDLGRLDVAPWVDGGWGVDALLGWQTREHDDLDLVVRIDYLPRVSELLGMHGFGIERDWLPTALAMRHPDGRAVDLHPVELSSDGGGDQTQIDGVTRWHYAPPVPGRIADKAVSCCSAECQLAAHLGYEPEETDRADMRLLAQHFGLDLPPPYRHAG